MRLRRRLRLITTAGATDALSPGTVSRDASTVARTPVTLGILRFTAAAPCAAVGGATLRTALPRRRRAATASSASHQSGPDVAPYRMGAASVV